MSPSQGIWLVLFALVLYSSSSTADTVGTNSSFNGTGTSTSCRNGSSSSTTTRIVVITETKSVFNSTTGQWVNVTTSRNSTVVSSSGSSSSNCSSRSDVEEWKAFVYFKEYMKKWSFQQWAKYMMSVSQKEWDFKAFAMSLGDNLTDIPCDGHVKFQMQISNIMNIFQVLKSIQDAEDRNVSCNWLKHSLHMSYQHQRTCMDDDDESDQGMDSSHSGIMARRLRKTHTAEMNGFGEILCSLPFKGNRSVWTNEKGNKTCDLWAVRNIILASLHIMLGWDDGESCSEATMALSYLKEHLKPCNARLRFLLAVLIRQAEMKQKMVCTPPTCNIPYASTCALEVEMKMKKFVESMGHGYGHGGGMNGTVDGDMGKPGMNGSGGDNMGRPRNGTDMPGRNSTDKPMKDKVEKFCREMMVAMACVANHTISCDKDKYGGVNMKMKIIGKHFRRICSDVIVLPPEKCMPPPQIPVGRYRSDDDKGKDRGEGKGGYSDKDKDKGGDKDKDSGKGDKPGDKGPGGDDKGKGGQGNDSPQMRVNSTRGNGSRGSMGGGSMGMRNMSMSPVAYLVKYMAQFSLFDDAFLCQILLSEPETRNNSMLVAQFCGMKNVSDDLFCLHGTYSNGSFTSMDVEKCDKGSYCKWYYDSASDVETMGCAVPSECNSTLTGSDKRNCCKDNLCNRRVPSKIGCTCDVKTAMAAVNSTLKISNATNQDCYKAFNTLSRHLNGCPDFKRNVFVSKPNFYEFHKACPSVEKGSVLNIARCGSACHTDKHKAEKTCEALGFDVCKHTFTKCVAILTSGCSKSEMLRRQHARLMGGNRICTLDQRKEFLMNATASSNKMVSTGYIPAKLVSRCTDYWFSAENTANKTWDEVILGLNGCLRKSNATALPMSMTANKIQNLVSKMAAGVIKAKSEGDFDPDCFDRSGVKVMGIIASYASEVYSGNTGICVMSRAFLPSAKCPPKMIDIVMSAITPDCLWRWVDISQNCSLRSVQRCFAGMVKAPEKNWMKLGECLNKTLAATYCEADISMGIRKLAHKLYEHFEMDYMKPGDGYDKDDDDDEYTKEDDKDGKDKYMRPMPYTKENIAKYYGNSSCVCDPALAVHCIFQVNHLSKQDDPDWENLCPMVNKSAMCAHRFVQGCGECQQKTVKEIVGKLSYGLRKTCMDPPETQCKSIKAMDCVTDLMEYHTANRQTDNITTCVEIAKTVKCIGENLKDCEKTTELKINRLLNQVIDRWEGLKCEAPTERLGTCRDLFEEDVNSILAFDVDEMFSNMETNDTEQWEQFQEHCEGMRSAWKCVDDTLDLGKDRRGSDIIKDSLKAVYMSVKKICQRITTPLQCYECYGAGSRSCASGPSIETCNKRSICQTVTDNGVVESRGCTPRPSCKPGCNNKKCTYCCSEDRCNDLDNGPITGSCNRRAAFGCMFDLSRRFTETKEFACVSVELALDCLKHERTQCELGGVSFALEEVSTLKLRAQVQVCLLKEASQICTIQPITTTASFLAAFGMYLDRDSICRIVADNRRSLKIASENCTEIQLMAIRRNVMAFENSLGFLDCTVPYGFVVGKECRISDAMECLARLDNDMESNTTLSCTNATALARCVRRNLRTCRNSWFTLPVRIRFAIVLRERVKDACDDAKFDEGDDDQDSSVNEMQKCLMEYTRKMMVPNPLKALRQAVEDLQDCLFDLDSDLVLTLNSVQKLYLERVTNYIEVIIGHSDMEMEKEHGNKTDMKKANATVSDECRMGINYLARHHFLDALALPTMVRKDVPAVCKSLSKTVEKVTKVKCAAEIQSENAMVEHVFQLLDKIREHFFVTYCDADPIPRCLVSRAEQCLAQFSAYISPGSDNSTELCMEARSLVKCTKSFAATCTCAQSVIKLRSQASFALETITQVCFDYPDLVAEARCSLLRQVNSEPGCNTTALAECTAPTENTTCTQLEKDTACFVKNAGQCLPQAQSVDPKVYQSFTKQLATCRAPTWPDGTRRDAATLFRPCGQAPGKCDVSAAAGCLSALVVFINQPDANFTEGYAVARACLEKNFYCFSSVITLLSSNITEYSKLLVHVLHITPAWTQIESGRLIHLLNLPGFVLRALQKTPPVSLDLWDICWNLDRALDLLMATKKQFPDMELSSFKYATQNLKFAIQSSCNDFDAVSQMLQFPQQENPTCAASVIRQKMKVLMTRSIAEFYNSQEVGARSVCSFFMALNASMSVSLQQSTYSLEDCSDGFRAQMMFSMRIVHLMIRNRCEMAQSGGSPRCSVKAVSKCVHRLYYKYMLLGHSETQQSICSEVEKAEACVTRFSFKCDSSRMGRVGWMWRSVSRAAKRTCEQERPVAICDDEMDPDHARCDVRKARQCSLRQYRNFIDPFLRRSKKCRSLYKNMECIQTYTRNCNGTKLPKLFLLDPDEVEDIQEKLGCQEEEMDNTFGCRSGCMVDSAQACLAAFQKGMTDNMWGQVNKKTCGMINDMRFCVAKQTKSCRVKEKRGLMRAVDNLLEKFPKHHEACVDVATCSADFDSLVRQIEGLRMDDDSDYVGDVYGYDDECEDSDDEDDTKDKDTKDTKDKDKTDTKDKDKTDTKDKDKTDTKDKDKTDTKDKDKKKKKKTCDKDKKPKTADKDTKDKDKDTKDKDKDTKDKDKDTKDKDKDTKDKDKPDTKDKDKPDTKDKDKPDTKDKDKPDTKDKDKPDTKDKDKDDTKDKDKDDKDDDDDEDDIEDKPSGPSLQALCNRIRILYNTCVKPGLKLLPPEKSKTARAMYKSIMAAVEEKCTDTTQLQCYACKNEKYTDDCEKEIQVCPNGKRACLFKQTLAGTEVRTSAYCANPNSCYNNGDGNTQRSCCYGDLCNTASGVSVTAITLEPQTCKFEYALMCALDFTMSYISTDEISCRRTTQRLSCVQRYGQTCTSAAGKSLVAATNSVFLELASTRCVVDSQPGDCFSLAIFSMQSILSNAYVSDGNTPCVGLQETEASVAQTIANGNCTEAGRISLESSLAFVKNIVGPHCEPGSCEAVSWADVINGDGSCSGYIFQGIKYIYQGYGEMAKSQPDCGLLTSYVEEARNLLGNCKMVAFLKSKLEALESSVQQRCGEALAASLPDVCVGQCQTEVVIGYVRNLRTVFDNANTSSATCLTLMQVQRVYNVYTKDCTSVQQKDLLQFAIFTLRSEIEYCEQKEPSFDFELELRRDIYYEAVVCQVDFQNEVAAAFAEGSQERLCKAVEAFEDCQYEIPNVFEDFIMGPTTNLLALIESTGLCDAGAFNTTGSRRKRAACDVPLLSNLIQQLLLPPNIATSSFDSRDLFCQETAAYFEQAKTIRTACDGLLSSFQVSLFELVTTTVEANNEQLCPPLRFEEEGCNLNLINSCFKDYFTILRYANIGTPSVCRQARFSLECLNRFTETCKSAEQTKAMAIRKVALRMVKGVVVNKCPGMAEYLYCNGDLSVISEGCQLDKAKTCAAESTPELSERFTEGYCQSKQEKVDCTKENLIGCTDEQISTVSLPSVQLRTICGISNTSLSGICRSDAQCPMDEISACFNNSEKCSNQLTIVQCSADLNVRYPNCAQSLGSSMAKLNYLQYYSADLDRCGIRLTHDGNAVSKSLCLIEAQGAVRSLLVNATGTADQVLGHTVAGVSECLSGKDVSVNLDVGAVQKSLMYLNDTLAYANAQDLSGSTMLADNGTCKSSKAIACISRKILNLIYVKLLNIDERNKFCRSYTEDKAGDCLAKHLDSCPDDKKTWYNSMNARVDKAIADLGVCEPPQTCVVSEAFACINKFGTVISQYDRSKDKVALCSGRAEAQSCIESFTFSCSQGETDTVLSSYNELATQVNLESLCEGVVLPPPPICPELPERNRVCHMGSAFTCLFKFSINILQGDTLRWRHQCMGIQNMMSCVSRSTSGCKETDEDVKSIRRLLKEFVIKAGDHCPWLTENLCTEQAACPVTTAGCEVHLEYGLMNRHADVCTLERTATECVKNNTATCTKAQRSQAMNVMKKKIKAAGLPGDLMCEGGSIEGPLYSFLAASGDVTVTSRKTAACDSYVNLYNNVNTQFSNPQGKDSVTVAKSLIDQLYAERNVECDGRVSDECAVNFPVKGFATLITHLMVETEFSVVSFCAQSRALMMMNDTYDCSSELYNLLEPLYTSECLDEPVACSDAEQTIASCISSYGNFSSLSCSDQQKAAACVSTNLPAHCDYNADWLNATVLCPEVVVLQATHSQRSRQYVCESGLEGYFGWKRVAGSSNFSVTIDPVAADEDAVPKCLKGPNEKDPIPQIFYTGDTTQEPTADKVTFKVYGREDYKDDGPQEVEVGFTVNAGSETFELPSTKVFVNNRNIPNSVCSSINDPHMKTFDKLKYNNQDTGKFILFRHKKYAEAVVVQYSQCAKYGSCNCGVKVYAGLSSVTFDLCGESTDLLSYYAAAEAIALNQQRMAVMMNKDLKTYSVILLDSGTLVKIKIEGKYMNVWVIPSAKDIGKTQGLCGVFDGDGYNDFQLPDSSQYQMKESDSASGDLVPTDFNNAWKITNAQANDYTQVYFEPNKTISTDPVPIYCHKWMGEKSKPKCGKWANLATCGLINGEDQTASLLANFKQDSNSNGARKKRQAEPVEDEEETTQVQTPTWPTPSGWTLEQATVWCLDNIPDDTLQKCTEAITSLDGTWESFQLDEQVQDCIGDIKASDGTEWLEGARASAYEHCITELNQNPGYQNNAESSNLAIQFLDSTCSPPDCSGHGSCAMGVCDCYDGYFGTTCGISSEDLMPPVLKQPDGGVHMCEVDSNSECSSIFISGSNFVSSSKLSCHIREVEVTEFGLREVPNAPVEIVSARLIARDRVRCDLGERSTMKRSLRVSVSNDGVTPHAQYQLFVAYDPICFTCDSLICTRQTGVCVIGNTCVMPGVSSIYDECDYCDLMYPTQWTVRKDLDHCKEKLDDSGDSDSHLVPLIGAGCVLVALLIIAIVGLMIFLKRRDSRKRRERMARYGHGNPMYEGENPHPFDGSPVLHVNVRDDPSGKKLSLDQFQHDA